MQFPQDVFAAAELLDGRIRRTPVERSPALAGDSGARVWLKLENLQETGSFKLRGAFHKVLCLDEETRARGVIAALEREGDQAGQDDGEESARG